MKNFFILLFISIQLSALGKTVSRDSLPKQSFSKVFLSNKGKYDELIIFHVNGDTYSKWEHYRLIGRDNKQWYVADYFLSKLNPKIDSTVKKTISKAQFPVKEIDNALLQIKSESNISEPCKLEIRKDSVYEVTDLRLNSDVEYYIVEYKIKDKIGVISQLNPFEAAKICPLNQERKKFKTIVQNILNL